MAGKFKVLIAGGGVAGLSLSIMLEEYGFEYELLEKHADIAPKLGAGVGFTPNGARILDQIGLYESMVEAGAPINSGTAIAPDGKIVLHNSDMGEHMENLFGYKIQFVSRYKALNILHQRIRNKSSIHMKKELIKVESIGQKIRVETKDGSVYTGDLLIAADGVRSFVREELWRISETEEPGYIAQRDKSAIESTYTAVVGVAKDVSEIPVGESVRAYNNHRSYFYQQGCESTGELYWWLCVKNDKKVKGTIRGFTAEVKQTMVDKYKNDKVWQNLTFGDLYNKSIYSAVVPLEEYVLEKCFYKNILLTGDSFRKLHPVTGQGANSAMEESAMIADILWDLRDRKKLHDPTSFQNAFSEFQKARYSRLTALLENAHLVQRLESFDDGVLKFLALHLIPKLPFMVAFMPELGASFAASRTLQHFPPPRMGMWPFAPEIKLKPSSRSTFSSVISATIILFAASAPWWIQTYFPSLIEGNNLTSSSSLTLPQYHALQLYQYAISISVSGFWITESYRSDSLMSPLNSSTLFILGSIYWGWDKILPIYLCLHIRQSMGLYYYYMPPAMTDLGVARSLLPISVLIYSIPVLRSLSNGAGFADSSWKVAQCTFPLITYLSSKIVNLITKRHSDVEVIFGHLDIPYRNRFHKAILFVSSALHISVCLVLGPKLIDESSGLFASTIAKEIASLTAVLTLWCLYTAYELRRVNAIEVSVAKAWAVIILSTIVCGPAATLAGTWIWRTTQIAQSRSFQHQSRPLNKILNGKLENGKKGNCTMPNGRST